MKVNTHDRFYAMHYLYYLFTTYYSYDNDHVIDYMDTKTTSELEYFIKRLERGGEDERKILNDFKIWEDKNIIQEELCEIIIDVTECNSIDVLKIVLSLGIEDRYYLYSFCNKEQIYKEFECWRSKNELSQNN